MRKTLLGSTAQTREDIIANKVKFKPCTSITAIEDIPSVLFLDHSVHPELLEALIKGTVPDLHDKRDLSKMTRTQTTAGIYLNDFYGTGRGGRSEIQLDSPDRQLAIISRGFTRADIKMVADSIRKYLRQDSAGDDPAELIDSFFVHPKRAEDEKIHGPKARRYCRKDDHRQAIRGWIRSITKVVDDCTSSDHEILICSIKSVD
jgi:hypothetical protein